MLERLLQESENLRHYYWQQELETAEITITPKEKKVETAYGLMKGSSSSLSKASSRAKRRNKGFSTADHKS